MSARPHRLKWIALALTILGAICLLAVAVIATARSSERERASNRLLRHGREVSLALRETFADIEDAETGQRGYLLTGNTRYLAPFDQGSKLAPTDLDRLQIVTRDSAIQHWHAARLRPLVAAKLAELQQTITLYRMGQVRQALRIVDSDRGQHLMEDIRVENSQMLAEQARLVTVLLAQSDEAAHLTLRLVSGVLVLAFLLLVMAAWSVASMMTRQSQAEERIRDYTTVLEFQKNQLEMANAELEMLATTDGLTHLSNHRAFQQRLAEEVMRATRYGLPLSVILLDVDHFKQYNDAFGHPAGDEVLKRVGQLLRETARESDIVARYGGEEFALVLPQTNAIGAGVIAERIRRCIEDTQWTRTNITASFGVSTFGSAMANDDLVERADQALYHAKQTGRNRVALFIARDGYQAHEIITIAQEDVAEGRDVRQPQMTSQLA